MDTTDETKAALAHYLDQSREGAAVTVGDASRTDRGEVEEVSVDAGRDRDYLRVTVKIPIRRHPDR